MTIFWTQDAVCWKCRDRLSCPPDGDLWGWIREPEVVAFLERHKQCDDGKSVSTELYVTAYEE